jgi:hypothetical protein
MMRFRELAHRSNDGITVRLFWDTTVDRVLLRYRDAREADVFTTGVPEAEVLAPFEHPNAYRPAASLVRTAVGSRTNGAASS